MAWRAMPRCNNMSLRRTKSKVAITFARHFRNTDAYLSRDWPMLHPARLGGLDPGSLDSTRRNPLKAVAVPDPKQLNFEALLATAHALADRAGRSYCRISGQASPLTIKEAISSIPSPRPTATPKPPSATGSPTPIPSHGILGEEFGAHPARCRILLGDRSDRRHPRLHPRPAALGHADRADPRRRAAARPDGPALHRRALLERRDRILLPP